MRARLEQVEALALQGAARSSADSKLQDMAAQDRTVEERASEPKIFLSMEGDTHLGALNVEKNAAFRDKLSAYFTQALNAKIAPPKPD